ncbi:MAG TPA: hypothetical protein VGH73_07100 [Thermoanaerobaculia bacterium]
MKLRSTLLVFVSLLLIAGAAMAAPVGVPAPASSAPEVAAAPAPAPGLCIKNSTKATLPELKPAFFNASTLVCGSCSTPVCRGAGYNAVCKVSGTLVYKCIAAYGNDCTDGTPQCQCWNGPLP